MHPQHRNHIDEIFRFLPKSQREDFLSSTTSFQARIQSILQEIQSHSFSLTQEGFEDLLTHPSQTSPDLAPLLTGDPIFSTIPPPTQEIIHSRLKEQSDHLSQTIPNDIFPEKEAIASSTDLRVWTRTQSKKLEEKLHTCTKFVLLTPYDDLDTPDTFFTHLSRISKLTLILDGLGENLHYTLPLFNLPLRSLALISNKPHHSLPSVLPLLQHAHEITHLHLSDTLFFESSPEEQKAFFACFPKVQKLTIQATLREYSGDTISILLGNTQKVQSLSLINLNISDENILWVKKLISGIPRLRSLDLELTPAHQNSISSLSSIAGVNTQVESLTISNLTELKDLTVFLRSFPNLKYLSFPNLKTPGASEWKSIFDELPNSLVGLSLTGNTHTLPPELLDDFPTHLAHLSLKNNQFLKDLTPSTLRVFLSRLPALTSLDLSYIPLCAWGEEHFLVFKEHPSLKHLNLSNTQLSDLPTKVIQSSGQYFQHLHTLVIDGDNNMFPRTTLSDFFFPLSSIPVLRVPKIQTRDIVASVPSLKRLL